jgi:hypothetical protein
MTADLMPEAAPYPQGKAERRPRSAAYFRLIIPAPVAGDRTVLGTLAGYGPDLFPGGTKRTEKTFDKEGSGFSGRKIRRREIRNRRGRRKTGKEMRGFYAAGGVFFYKAAFGLCGQKEFKGPLVFRKEYEATGFIIKTVQEAALARFPAGKIEDRRKAGGVPFEQRTA